MKRERHNSTERERERRERDVRERRIYREIARVYVVYILYNTAQLTVCKEH